MPFVVRANMKKESGSMPVLVRSMTADHAEFWDRYIKPYILLSPVRADRAWSWRKIRMMTGIWLTGRFRCRGFTLLVQGRVQGRRSAIPAGMLLLIEEYPMLAPPPNPLTATFTWFLTGAPATALDNLGADHIPDIAPLLIDTALVNSNETSGDGRMWLHAAPAGKQFLLDYYGNTVGMSRYPRSNPMPARVYRRNDGRYFSLDVMAAQILLAQSNPLR